ncbi:hypothetical protein L484_017355 [Morus notabilis]|uniref:Uncharacterized protein n=1 Tax=Morus notabilis TaxID=981085 RepID=W9RRQ4_9ROSA|nr:hypothetical protein L484_017355 [Morus notabilis]
MEKWVLPHFDHDFWDITWNTEGMDPTNDDWVGDRMGPTWSACPLPRDWLIGFCPSKQIVSCNPSGRQVGPIAYYPH